MKFSFGMMFAIVVSAASMVPATASAEGTVMNWTVDGVKREALVFPPAAAGTAAKAPVVFVFHGHGGNMHAPARGKAAFHNLWPEAVVVYAQGLPTPMPKDPQGLRPGWQVEPGQVGDRDLKFFDAMLATLRQKYPVDDRRIYATGFSNGAGFTYLLWSARAQTLAAFGIVAGALPSSVHLTTPRPVFIVAGETDQVLPFSKQQSAIEASQRVNGGVSVVTRIHPEGHVYPPWAGPAIVEFFKAQALAAPQAETESPSAGEVVAFSSQGKTLHGFLFKPSKGTGPFPALIYNHGSEQYPGSKPELAKFYTDSGFVFFVPHRSGHGRSSDAGPWISDELKSFRTANKKGEEAGKEQIRLLERSNRDVIAAVQWLKAQPYVDTKKIAMSGVSYGGIETILAAEQNTKQNLGLTCFVPFAPAAMSWKANPLLGERLAEAIRNSVSPLFLIQAENDYSLSPSQKLGPLIDAKGFPNRHKVYPPYGTTQQEGHGAFSGKTEAIQIWSKDVIAFLKDCREI